MTLNQLAWEMWERLGYQGIDPSVLSRVLKGERLFTFRQLETFCDILSVPKLKFINLQGCLLKELRERLGIEDLLLSDKKNYLIELVEDNLEKIDQARLGDSLHLASDWAATLHELIHRQLEIEKDRTRRFKWINLLSDVITEIIELNLGSSYSKDLPQTVGVPAVELRKVGVSLKNKTLIGKSLTFEGGIHYVFGKYSEGIGKFNKALKLIDTPAERAFALRLLALCYAYKNKKREFSPIREEIISNKNRFPLHEQCEQFEALGRSEALLGESSASRKILQEAWDIYNQIEAKQAGYKVARKIQLIRTEAEAAIALKDKAGFRNIESLCEEAMMLSAQFGYKSYIEKINNLLSEGLN